MNGSTARRTGRHGRTCSGILLCFVALFAQVVLPIAHRYFPDVEETAHRTTGAGEDARCITTPVVAVPEVCRKGPSEHSAHDPESCAVCQVLLHASSFIGAMLHGPAYTPSSMDLFAVDDSPGIPARHGPTESQPRAPPPFSRSSRS